MDPLTLAGRLAARAVRAYRAELARLTPDSPPARSEMSCTSAVTSQSWQPTQRQKGMAHAMDGIGFTAQSKPSPQDSHR
jgi:hypothetical protein